LLATTGPKHPPQQPAARPEVAQPASNASGESAELTVSSPDAAADVLQRHEADVAVQRESSSIVVSETVDVETPNASNGSEAAEENNLRPW
jgi:hypothetical protein